MTEHVGEEQLILHYYGESGDSGVIDRHMGECADCRAQYQNLQRVLNSVDAAPVPERPADYAESVWQKVQPHIKRSPWRGLLSPRRWAPAFAMAALVIAAFLAGRYSPRADRPATMATQTQVRERVLLVAVGDHLDRSKMVLIELANAPAKGDVDITGERIVAESLVEANRLYRQTALATGDAGVANVLDDLERVLLEIAHSPDRISATQFENLRKRIEDEGLLFKVRVIGSQIRERDEKPAESTGSAKL
jgi:hypothetical protein